VSKSENKSLTVHYNLNKFKGFGCPLLYEVHKKFPHMKRYSIQRILRETRSGVLEPGEALDLIWSFYKTD
jgi:predicted PP-loop superfamily ATPase